MKTILALTVVILIIVFIVKKSKKSKTVNSEEIQENIPYLEKPIVTSLMSSGFCKKTVKFNIQGNPNDNIEYTLDFSPDNNRSSKDTLTLILDGKGKGVIYTSIGVIESGNLRGKGSDSVTLNLLKFPNLSKTESFNFTNCNI